MPNTDPLDQQVREAVAVIVSTCDVDTLISNDYYELASNYDLKLITEHDADAWKTDEDDETCYVCLVIELIGPAVSIVGTHRVPILTVAVGSVPPDHASIKEAVNNLLDELITTLKLPS